MHVLEIILLLMKEWFWYNYWKFINIIHKDFRYNQAIAQMQIEDTDLVEADISINTLSELLFTNLMLY